jgi:hypothetical protein
LFIKQSIKTKRLQKNGMKVRSSTIENYFYLQKLLVKFNLKRESKLRILSVKGLSRNLILRERKYWNKFYIDFTNYLYHECDLFDNYVSGCIRILRAFFNFLNEEQALNIGTFHYRFYVLEEEIETIILFPEQLNFLIYDKEFENSLPEHLKQTKDFFVFGCTVALRFSDLMNLYISNFSFTNDNWYLSTISKKTGTSVRMHLPDYAVEIMQKHTLKTGKIFKTISLNQLNKNIKAMAKLAGWDEETDKFRHKRGIPYPIYKNPETKEKHKFYEMVSSHTMRRTAISTMLALRMPEVQVRRISGHVPNSKSFYRYVNFAQSFWDNDSKKFFKKLSQQV